MFFVLFYYHFVFFVFFFFSSRRRHTRSKRDWSSDVCSSDLVARGAATNNRHIVTFSGSVPTDFAAQVAALGGKVLWVSRSEEHTSELQSRFDLVCRLLLEKKKFN